MSDFDFFLIPQVGLDRAWGGELGLSNATYTFGAATGTALGSTLTETITEGNRSTTIVYTETALASGSTPAQFQIIPPAGHDAATPTTDVPTYSFISGAGGSTTVVETITTASITEKLSYSGGTRLSDDLITINTPSATVDGVTITYSFANPNAVTETVTYGSISHSATTIIPTAVFAVTAGGGESETLASGNTVQTITYTPTSAGLVIASVDTATVAQGSATTPLDIDTGARAEIAVGTSSTLVTPVSPGGTLLTAYTAPASAVFVVEPAQSVAGSFVEETITHGTHSQSVLFYSATGTSGIYTAVAEGTTISVAGVAAQLAQLPSAVLALL